MNRIQQIWGSTWAKIPFYRSRTLIGQFPEENSNEKNSNQGLSIQVNGVSVENYNTKLIDNEQGDLVVEDLSKILKTLENKGYIIR